MKWLPVLNFVFPAGIAVLFLWIYGKGLWKKELSARDTLYFPCFILIFVAITATSWDKFILFFTTH